AAWQRALAHHVGRLADLRRYRSWVPELTGGRIVLLTGPLFGAALATLAEPASPAAQARDARPRAPLPPDAPAPVRRTAALAAAGGRAMTHPAPAWTRTTGRRRLRTVPDAGEARSVATRPAVSAVPPADRSRTLLPAVLADRAGQRLSASDVVVPGPPTG